MDNTSGVEGRRFPHGLTQHNNVTTHNSALSVCDPCLSSIKGKSFGDHLAVQFVINMHKHDCIRRKITHRKYHGINIQKMSGGFIVNSIPE